ncbi:hypothetical protein GQ600_6427 [Phytophthora cactorum]|nr:hypothetical protein GQ600_6427 [Phytophthora cactorum]
MASTHCKPQVNALARSLGLPDVLPRSMCASKRSTNVTTRLPS